MDSEPNDSETLAFTSFSRLGFQLAESPMPPAGSPFLHERCLIRSPGSTTVVFIGDTSELVGPAALEQVATRVLARRASRTDVRVGPVRRQPPERAAMATPRGRSAFAGDAESVAVSCGIAVATAVDLLLLTIGAEKFGWDPEEIRKSLQRPGRQATSPPGCKKLGTVHHFYEHPQVASVAVDQLARVRVGDTIIIRLRDRYHQQAVESLQVNRVAVPEVLGGGLAGLQTSLHRGDVPIGAPVFIMETGTRIRPTGRPRRRGRPLATSQRTPSHPARRTAIRQWAWQPRTHYDAQMLVAGGQNLYSALAIARIGATRRRAQTLGGRGFR